MYYSGSSSDSEDDEFTLGTLDAEVRKGGEAKDAGDIYEDMCLSHNATPSTSVLHVFRSGGTQVVLSGHVTKSFSILLDCLQHTNNCVESFVLADSKLAASDIHFLARYMEIDKLTSLELSSCKLGKHLSILLPVLGTIANMRELGLSSNSVGDRHGTILAANLQSSQMALEVLDLSSNDIGVRGGKALASYFGSPSAKTLVAVDVAWNVFAASSAVLLSSVLSMRSLTKLNLAYCGLKDDNATECGDLIGLSSSIKALDMSHNSLGHNTALAIAKNIPSASMLAVLELGFNSLGR
jgi:Ran GTPase-activating protein (RanGAP) involved in mRNA processing and transport